MKKEWGITTLIKTTYNLLFKDRLFPEDTVFTIGELFVEEE